MKQKVRAQMEALGINYQDSEDSDDDLPYYLKRPSFVTDGKDAKKKKVPKNNVLGRNYFEDSIDLDKEDFIQFDPKTGTFKLKGGYTPDESGIL